ncbi:tetratricopeptide repeat protein [Oscillochloris sp. ZM17-4]|uniref:serine/threonine-protein kinase n=1 Tax=Oscillochloris sp. ZM17-4 TaxID=2866714 RepID=UPI001C732755|nr:serine/threonine-protein kinase [Oscillochloris sp. ZM17-4]MBX0326128.1 tetratricopeptide repeat protein [Oscillochloris sp. ZM17-4]
MSQLNLIGTTLGRFEIISELGRGGMAVVYKARQGDLDRIVALKILPPEMTHDTSYIARFRQEARSAARLEHPHIMPIYEVGEADGMHYIAMKFIQGRTLKDLVQEDGALSVRRAAEILAQVGDALDHAHRQGVIHRDIKPSNIMITDEGWVYLTDFGLARGTGANTGGLTMAGTVMGTPEYMSPEQAQGLPSVGPPTDIYALGVVLYELITGTFPFHAETPMAMLAARLLQAPIPPRDVRGDLPPAVEDVVMRSLARKPEARFPSSAAMVAALRAAAGIGADPHAQPQITPVGGTPAVGETIVAGGRPAPTPPYVQPQIPTPPPQAQVSAPAGTPQWGTPPTPALPPLPTITATPAPPPLPGTPVARPKTGLFIGIGAAALVLVLAVIGGLALIGRPGPEPDPQPAPTSAQVAGLIAQGDADLAAGKIDKALAGYRQAVAQSAGNTAALGGIALAYNLHADWPQAEASANDLVNAALADDQAAALGLTLLADAIASQDRVADAIEPIQQALDLDSGLSLAQAIHSNIMAIQANDSGDTAAMDEALRAADASVDSMADETPLIQALTYNAIAVTFSYDYSLTGNASSMTESEADYQKALDLLPDIALFHSNLGYLYSSDKRYDDARDSFHEALRVDPSYANAQIGIGWSYYGQDETDKAAEAFDAAIKLNPDSVSAYIARGRLAFDQDDYDTAIERFQSATQRDARSVPAYTWLGKAYQFSGFYNEDSDQQKQEYASAAEAYRSALAINGSDASAASGLGWVLQYQDKYDESIAAFEQALALDDGNDETHNGLAWSLFNLGRYDEAEPSFRRAIAISSDYASAHYGLGRALEELGRTDEARAEYQQTLDLDPSYTSAQDALDRIGK